MIKFKIINSGLAQKLRFKILRHGKPIGSEVFIEDDYKETFHLGLFDGSNLFGVVTMVLKSHPQINDSVQYQLRGMAIDHSFQQKGFGKQLVKLVINEIKERQCFLIWCNARVSAVNFYMSSGFLTIGETFDIPQVGPHQVMFRKLD